MEIIMIHKKCKIENKLYFSYTSIKMYILSNRFHGFVFFNPYSDKYKYLKYEQKYLLNTGSTKEEYLICTATQRRENSIILSDIHRKNYQALNIEY